ncbi:MAG: ABC transporter [Bacteroidia bacterium]|nr:MAG: ABC transporter [Bacteroidia bacterium]
MVRNIINTLSPRGKAYLLISIVAFVLRGLCGMGMLLAVLGLIDTQMHGGPVDPLRSGLLVGGLLLLKTLCNAVADMAKHFAGFDLVEQIRQGIILRMKRFSLGFYTNERLGEISTIIHKDVDSMEGVVAHMWSRMVSDFALTLILGLWLFRTDWRMGLAMVALLPVALFSLLRGLAQGRRIQAASQDRLGDMVSLFLEYMRGIPVLKVFGAKGLFRERLEQSVRAFGQGSKEAARATANNLGRFALWMELSFALMATAGLLWVYRGELPLLAYLTFIVLSREFYKPFLGMEGHYINYIRVSDSYRRISRLLNAPVVEQVETPRRPERFDVSFERVDFGYGDGGFRMQGVSLHVPENTVCALVGPSGSGKTTITSLLLRFYEPTAGSIRIGGVDIRQMDYDHLLGQISIVMQNVILFSDTIASNILVGRRTATRAEVEQAARRAMIHDFIVGLPEGYDTVIGENGLGLSGGQKQRLSIARAFLKDAPILLLDEITSNVDPVNEHQIQLALSELVRGRTVIVIAHHLQTVQTAQQIVVMQRGRLVERGTHKELLGAGGTYAKMVGA